MSRCDHAANWVRQSKPLDRDVLALTHWPGQGFSGSRRSAIGELQPWQQASGARTRTCRRRAILPEQLAARAADVYTTPSHHSRLLTIERHGWLGRQSVATANAYLFCVLTPLSV